MEDFRAPAAAIAKTKWGARLMLRHAVTRLKVVGPTSGKSQPAVSPPKVKRTTIRAEALPENLLRRNRESRDAPSIAAFQVNR